MGTDIRVDRDRFNKLGAGSYGIKVTVLRDYSNGLQGWIKVFKLVS